MESKEVSHILIEKVGEGWGSEVEADDDNEALVMAASAIIAAFRFMDKESHDNALASIRSLLDSYEIWINDPNLEEEWKE